VTGSRRRRVYGVRVARDVIPQLADIDLSEHAVEQYRERAKPALELAAARAELAQLVLGGDVVREPPDWTRSASAKPFHLVIADTLALPLAPQAGRWITTTCLVRATMTPRRREQRAAHKARRAAVKRAQRRARR